ncbi:hypothetical protein K458DRAFT_469483 [Lentithecium fluviatile CBS 122367]|uniref:Uncharacterized protein n=1 Tax=Lentithecium fluviatile CBS 122367 TaxID=1168545 RepID=A0A6G1IDE6_9PLEO|nr:hypothetical protein K458DRAFT_469483 [Lentithecium fluviatile CBS 122367]
MADRVCQLSELSPMGFSRLPIGLGLLDDGDEQIEQQLELHKYRDRTSGQTSRNLRERWVVFHFHFDSTSPRLTPLNGHTNIAFTAITMYHSTQTVVELRSGPIWRAGHQDQAYNAQSTPHEYTHRSVSTCPWVPRYPGQPLPSFLVGPGSPAESPYTNMFNWLAGQQRLF